MLISVRSLEEVWMNIRDFFHDFLTSLDRDNEIIICMKEMNILKISQKFKILRHGKISLLEAWCHERDHVDFFAWNDDIFLREILHQKTSPERVSDK